MPDVSRPKCLDFVAHPCVALTDGANVKDAATRLVDCNALVQPFTAEADSSTPRGERFPGFGKVVYDVDSVSIDRANIENRHAPSRLSIAQSAAMLIADEKVSSRLVCSPINGQCIFFRQCPWIIGKKASLPHCVPG